VVSQDPGTTLEVLAGRKATVTTAPSDKVIDIELDDAHAPVSCGIFRSITGLVEHDAGMLPVFMKFDDVVLFRPTIPTGIKINPENVPVGEAPAAGIGITNDSRKNTGLVGVRLSANREFGPTSEPFEGTNMIGRVIDTEKLKKVKETGKSVYQGGATVTEYTPVHVGTVTKYVVVESFDITPADLAVRAYEIAKGAMIKETCFGLVINGKEEEVDRIISELRTIDPDHIFIKDRGFPPGDSPPLPGKPRRCTPGVPWHGAGDDDHPLRLPRARSDTDP